MSTEQYDSQVKSAMYTHANNSLFLQTLNPYYGCLCTALHAGGVSKEWSTLLENQQLMADPHYEDDAQVSLGVRAPAMAWLDRVPNGTQYRNLFVLDIRLNTQHV